MKYRASVGTGFRAPSLFEITYNERPVGVYPPAAATPLKEETSQGYDLGIEYAADNGLHFEVTYFDQEIEDAIVYFFDSATFDDGYLLSIGTSTSKGVELGVYAPFGEQWAFIGNWTNNDTETTAVNRGCSAPRIWATSASNTRRPTTRSGSSRTTAVARCDRFRRRTARRLRGARFVGGLRFNETFELYGRVQNATDETTAR